ncbi:MAG: imidazolonepropionase [Gammaproteobacteria bacterium]|nr:imidazolonepropionase [Gammaproteobacteria bacterium]
MSKSLSATQAIANADLILYNGHFMTFEGDKPYGALNNAFITIKANTISYIGVLTDNLTTAISDSTSAKYDLQSRWVSPGLIDCHTHIVYGGNRSAEFEMRLQGISYEEIAKQGGGILSTVKATRAANHESLINSALKRLRHLFDEGVTTVEIKSGYGLDKDSEIKMLEVIAQLKDQVPATITATFLGAHAVPPEFKDQPDQYIDYLIAELLPLLKEKQLADCVDAFCETIGFSHAQVKRLFQAAQLLGFNLKLHAEQLSDQGGSELAASMGALSVDHLEFLSDSGIAELAERGTVAVLLPAAFYFLRETQLPPIDKLRQQKVPMALATDCNPGSSPCTSLLLVLNMACTLFRMTPEEALLGVTKNAAAAIGRQESIGSLAPNKLADLVIWDIEQPADLAYAIGANPCVAVIHQGQWVLDKLT